MRRCQWHHLCQVSNLWHGFKPVAQLQVMVTGSFSTQGDMWKSSLQLLRCGTENTLHAWHALLLLYLHH
jgi:hypothetical protein